MKNENSMKTTSHLAGVYPHPPSSHYPVTALQHYRYMRIQRYRDTIIQHYRYAVVNRITVSLYSLIATLFLTI
jgi:hypothetical protein